MYEKLTKCLNFTWFLHKRLSKYPNVYDICPKNKQNSGILYDFCPKNARILHNNCRKNIFSLILGAWDPLPPPCLLRLWFWSRSWSKASGLGLSLGLKACGLSLGLGLEVSGLINIHDCFWVSFKWPELVVQYNHWGLKSKHHLNISGVPSFTMLRKSGMPYL